MTESYDPIQVATSGHAPEPHQSNPSPVHHFLDLLYGILLHPVSTMKRIAADAETASAERESNYLLYGMVFIVLVSGTSPLVQFMGNGGDMLGTLAQMPMQAIYGLFAWFSMASLYSTLAYGFTTHGHYRAVLTTTSFACIPWLLLLPVSLVKFGMSGLGMFLGVLLSMGIWIWVVCLYALALSCVFQLRLDRLLTLMFSPFLVFFIGLAWAWGLFINLSRVFP